MRSNARPLWTVLLAVCGLVLGSSPASADTYQNDGFEDNAQVGFQGGFIVGEMAGACFDPGPDAYPLQLTAIRLLFGGAALGSDLATNFRVFESGGNGTPPGDLMHFAEDIELISANDAMSELDITGIGLTVNSAFCVAVEFQHAGLPSVARDSDGTVNAGNNWIYALDPLSGAPIGWVQSNLLGLEGDWIMRVVGTPGSGTGPGTDTGTGPGTDTGGTDAGTGSDTGAGNDTGTGSDTGVDTGTGGEVSISNVEQDGEDPSQPVVVTIEGDGFQSSFRYRVSARNLSDVAVSTDGSEVVGVIEAGDLGPGTYDVIVSGDFGEETYSSGVILIDPTLPRPAITTVTPGTTSFGSSASITVVGDNFDESARVLINSRALPSTTVVNDQTITSFVPGDHVSEPGEYDLIVETDGGRSLSYLFTFEGGSGGSDGGCTSARGNAPWLFACVALLALRRRK